MARLSWSKLSKHHVLMKDESIVPSLPETHQMTRQKLDLMLQRYGKVIIKPTQSWGGNGVMMISSSEGRFEVKRGRAIRRLVTSSEVWSYIARKKAAKRYLVQQYIPLLKVDGRPCDIRVMVQRRNKGQWTVTGKLVKVAGSGHFITNTARSRGRVTTVSQAIAGSPLAGVPASQISNDIDVVSRRIARRLGHSYGRLRVVGLDMAIDRNGKVWLIEANFSPAVSLFRRLKNKRMYHRILSYQKG